jgi:hypothetical protein
MNLQRVFTFLFNNVYVYVLYHSQNERYFPKQHHPVRPDNGEATCFLEVKTKFLNIILHALRTGAEVRCAPRHS